MAAILRLFKASFFGNVIVQNSIKTWMSTNNKAVFWNFGNYNVTSEYVWVHSTVPQWDQIKISDKTFQDFLSLQKLKLRNVPFLWFNSFRRHFDLFLDNACHVKITIDFVSFEFILHLHRIVCIWFQCERFSFVGNQKLTKKT